MATADDDRESHLRLEMFKQELATLGWNERSNLTMDVRWARGDIGRASAYAKELVALNPDIIVTQSSPVTAAVQQETRTIPTIFIQVADPVGSGFVKTLSRPGGNITGFVNVEPSLAEKWLQLLKEVAPHIRRAGVMFNPKTAPYADYYLQRIKAAAPKFEARVTAAPVADGPDIERAIIQLGRVQDGGLVVMIDSFMFVHRKAIIALAATHKVPAIYYYSAPFVEEGGLIGYGFDVADIFRRAAPFVDRILRGAKPADLPVEQPTKFGLAVNLKTAKALGLTIPQSILLRADKVIE